MLPNQISTIIPGDSLAILRAELKSQNKHVKNLKKKSLWSRILEEVMEKLVDIVHFLHLEIHEAFGAAGNKVNNIDDYYFDYLWCEDYKYIKVIFSDCPETSASQPRVYEDWITRNVADVVCIVFLLPRFT
ncbi:uncharacterized protein LOC105791933 [Gossypium raimondii]|uniref:uncharacterized protein LOC105791933 n=1 Tax=Gossypium raimondii TaxID=29730 RepID=UPI00227C2061|nr:uncharacterized protein LOC105791933 [Gossypium raimondii]XP_052490511.1 uncharacterized protein LOC105791933 [Gossypium raimondii]